MAAIIMPAFIFKNGPISWTGGKNTWVPSNFRNGPASKELEENISVLGSVSIYGSEGFGENKLRVQYPIVYATIGGITDMTDLMK